MCPKTKSSMKGGRIQVLLYVFLIVLCFTLVTSIDLKIVQLGDSYSSGLGATDPHNYDTSTIPECYRTSHGWGGQYAERIRETQNYNVTYINGACAGAKSLDLLNPNLIAQTWGLCPFLHKRKRNKVEVFYNRTRFKLKCNKYAKPQINYVDETTDLVLITIGGNDALFSQIMSNCILGISIQEAQNCVEALTKARTNQGNYTETIKEALVEIWKKMGETGNIVLLQYPHLVQDYPRIWKDPHSGVSIDGPRLVRQFTIDGNHAYSVAAAELNNEMGVDFLAVFDKTMDLFAHHEVDPRKHRRNQDRWINEFERPLSSIFHPNKKGHFEWGAAAALEGTFGLALS